MSEDPKHDPGHPEPGEDDDTPRDRDEAGFDDPEDTGPVDEEDE